MGEYKGVLRMCIFEEKEKEKSFQIEKMGYSSTSYIVTGSK